MSADRAIIAFALGMAIYSGPAVAADEEQPDTEFLEYLGMWEESDEDWLILDETVTTGKNEQSDPPAESDESLEKRDER